MGFLNPNLSNASAGIVAYPASASFGAGVATFGGFVPLALLGIIAVIAFILALVLLADWKRFQQMQGFVGWLVRTGGYFLWGLLTVILIGIPIGLIYLAGTAVAANPAVGWWIAGVIAAFFVLSFIGWLAKPYYQRIGQNMEKAAQAKQKRLAAMGKKVAT